MALAGATMSGRVCVVTGATSGIGRATALELARLGATVALVARDPSRGEEASAAIRAESGNPSVRPLHADLASQDSVRRLAAEIRDRYPQVHVLLNVAGVWMQKRVLTVDGLETDFAVNHLAPFLLTSLLLDILKGSAPARVVTVSSDAHKAGDIDFDDLEWECVRYRAFRAYANSKLANVLFAIELARRLEDTGVTSNCLHPGVVDSGLSRHFRGIGLVRPVLRLAFKTPEQGARTPVYLASSPEVEGVTGEYFSSSKPAAPSPKARDAALARRLWEVSARLAGLPV